MIKIYTQPPTRRSIVIGKKRYFLSFPSIVFIIEYNLGTRLRRNIFVSDRIIFYSLKVVFKDLKTYYYPPLPNIDAHLFVCLRFKKMCKNEDELVKKVIAKFWNSKFSGGRFPGLHSHIEGCGLLNFERWQEKTLQNTKWKPKAKDMIECKGWLKNQLKV